MTNRKSGIYKIENIQNGKFYIGSAVTLNIRKNKHFNELKKNTHYNTYLQNSYNKYGLEAFEFLILEECNKEQLIEREQYYIDTLKPAYNICPIAYSTLGRIPTIETKLKMSKSQTGRKHSEKSKLKMSLNKKGIKLSQINIINRSISQRKPILQFDKNMNLIQEFDSVSKVLDTYKNVSHVLKGNRKTCGGYIWKYKNI